MRITFGMRTGEIVDVREAIGPVEYGDLEERCEQADDPFEVFVRDLFENEELHYVTWIEIDGVRKEEPFLYPGIPNWWADYGIHPKKDEA